MTKQQELDALRAFYLGLGRDSYIGEWLAGAYAEVESSLRSDITPDVSIKTAQYRAAAIVAAAEATAAGIIARAEEAAKKREAAAEKAYDTICAAVHAAEHALHRL